MLETFATVAVSIFLEGLFFLFIGVLISSIIEVFISENTIRKLIPRNTILALLSASLLGLFFPICECGIVPVVHRLIKKGTPLPICITFLFASPIVNIVVLTSTFFAFSDIRFVVFLRFTGGLFVAVTAGFIIHLFYTNKKNDSVYHEKPGSITCSCTDKNNDHTHDCSTHSNTKKQKNIAEHILTHSIEEFFETGKYFITGILITAVIQSTVPRSLLSGLGSSFPASNLFMCSFSYVLSVCSNTDAFIARSFLSQFSTSALLCFMIFGAMFDIKTTIMLSKIFKYTFIIRLLLLILLLTLLYSFVTELL